MDFLLLAAAATILMVLWHQDMKKNMLFAAIGEDDVRVAAPSSQKRKSEPEDSSASDYVTHQTMGNIETAMQLGGCLARLFCARYRQLTQLHDAEIAGEVRFCDCQ